MSQDQALSEGAPRSRQPLRASQELLVNAAKPTVPSASTKPNKPMGAGYASSLPIGAGANPLLDADDDESVPVRNGSFDAGSKNLIDANLTIVKKNNASPPSGASASTAPVENAQTTTNTDDLEKKTSLQQLSSPDKQSKELVNHTKKVRLSAFFGFGDGIKKAEHGKTSSGSLLSGSESTTKDKRKSFNPFGNSFGKSSKTTGPPKISGPTIISIPDNPMVNSVLNTQPIAPVGNNVPEYVAAPIQQPSSMSSPDGIPSKDSQEELSSSYLKPSSIINIKVELDKEKSISGKNLARSGPPPLALHQSSTANPTQQVPQAPPPPSSFYQNLVEQANSNLSAKPKSDTKKRIERLEDQEKQFKDIIDSLVADNLHLHKRLDEVMAFAASSVPSATNTLVTVPQENEVQSTDQISKDNLSLNVLASATPLKYAWYARENSNGARLSKTKHTNEPLTHLEALNDLDSYIA